jgi:hypothetical protein
MTRARQGAAAWSLNYFNSHTGGALRRDTTFETARDELFAHMNRCNVLRAAEDEQREWMNDTIDYMVERYPSLSAEQLEELRAIGLRFCAPVIPHGKEHTALTTPAENEAGTSMDDAEEADSGAMAGAA